MDGTKFVERINTLLKKKNISKAEFYSDLNLANNSITAWGNKNQSPSADTALKIAQYLNTTVEYLLTGTETISQKNEKAEKTIEEIASIIQSYKASQ